MSYKSLTPPLVLGLLQGPRVFGLQLHKVFVSYSISFRNITCTLVIFLLFRNFRSWAIGELLLGNPTFQRVFYWEYLVMDFLRCYLNCWWTSPPLATRNQDPTCNACSGALPAEACLLILCGWHPGISQNFYRLTQILSGMCWKSAWRWKPAESGWASGPSCRAAGRQVGARLLPIGSTWLGRTSKISRCPRKTISCVGLAWQCWPTLGSVLGNKIQAFLYMIVHWYWIPVFGNIFVRLQYFRATWVCFSSIGDIKDQESNLSRFKILQLSSNTVRGQSVVDENLPFHEALLRSTPIKF